MSKELKPCQLSPQRAIEILWGEAARNQQPLHCTRKELCDAVEMAEESITRTQQPNEPLELCEKIENFVQTKFGYCFYTMDSQPFIYNLYVHPKYRRHGHSHELLEIVINEIHKSGYEGKILIQAKPRENSIGLATLERYYESMGLTVCDDRPPEAGGTP